MGHVADRLSALDASFLYLEAPTALMHSGAVSLFRPPAAGFDYEHLVELVSRRIALVPRYRQKVRAVPGHLANPVWVDDDDFDITYHVRRSALPRPGTDQQLRELVARIHGRLLDRDRPLWELYLVEGLSGNRFALITKTHHALVDGVSGVELETVLLDATPTRGELPDDDWSPQRAPGAARLVAGALGDVVRRPTQALDSVRGAAVDIRASATRLASTSVRVASVLPRVARPAPPSPLNVELTEQRRFAMTRTDLDDYKRVRKAHRATVNDVVLATVAGALRTWLLTRGEPVTPSTTVRAMVPVSVRNDGEHGQFGNRVTSYFVDLPVGEGNPVMRLHQVSFAMRGHNESTSSVGADSLVALSGFAPPTLHSLGARVASRLSRRQFNLVVTNVPGPQLPLYASGARLLEMYPVQPLAEGRALSVGVTSYDGSVFYGLTGDRVAMRDVDLLATCLEESLAELVGTVR